MKYIGPFFRINSLSSKEIESQLLFFCRESIKHIVLESRCGISIAPKTLKHSIPSEDLSGFKNSSPLLCIYKKAKPNIYSSKYSHSWDDSTFKKELSVSSNALMTLCLLECTKYYSIFHKIDTKLNNISKLYKSLSKLQLEFYYNYLRNNEGFFIDKKNGETPINGEFNLTEKDKKYKFSDQAFMMVAYFSYADTCKDDNDSSNYKSFSLEILDMFLEFKDNIYNLSLDECCKICFCFNIMYEKSKNEDCKQFLIDICEFILSKYHEIGPSLSNLESTSMTAVNLIMCYKHTNIALFKDFFIDIIELFKNLYNEENGIIQKTGDKKDIKYTSIEVILYLINLMLYQDITGSSELNSSICQIYKQYIINSGIITSFPEAPNLDSMERYINFTLKSDDLIEEIMFRMPNAISPDLSGLASIFVKNVTYSKKKESFTGDKNTFDSHRNMFLFFIVINTFLPKYLSSIALNTKLNKNSYIDKNIKASTVKNCSNEVSTIHITDDTITKLSQENIDSSHFDNHTDLIDSNFISTESLEVANSLIEHNEIVDNSNLDLSDTINILEKENNN